VKAIYPQYIPGIPAFTGYIDTGMG